MNDAVRWFDARNNILRIDYYNQGDQITEGIDVAKQLTNVPEAVKFCSWLVKGKSLEQCLLDQYNNGNRDAMFLHFFAKLNRLHDKAGSYELSLESANKGYALAQHHVSIYAFNNDKEECYKYAMLSAVQGEPFGMARLGDLKRERSHWDWYHWLIQAVKLGCFDAGVTLRHYHNTLSWVKHLPPRYPKAMIEYLTMYISRYSTSGNQEYIGGYYDTCVIVLNNLGFSHVWGESYRTFIRARQSTARMKCIAWLVCAKRLRILNRDLRKLFAQSVWETRRWSMKR